jgi:hypothetical protein
LTCISAAHAMLADNIKSRNVLRITTRSQISIDK